MSAEPERFSYGRRLQHWAKQHPDRPAIIFIPVTGEPVEYSWQTVEQHTNQLARLFAQKGVDAQSKVTIGLPNCPEHLFVALAAWKLGAMVFPLKSSMAPFERDQILEMAQPQVVAANWDNLPFTTLRREDLQETADFSPDPLPDIIPQPGKAMASGGSTGRSKLIVDPVAWSQPDNPPLFNLIGVKRHMIQLISGPLYHNAPFLASHWGLFQAHTLILMERFDAARVVDLIEQYQVSYAYMAPIMMSRVAKLPDVQARDFSSMRCLMHTAAPCPPWLKRAWIDLIGAEHLLEIFGATELVGLAVIWGDEWLEHPGSVGKPLPICDMKILDAENQEVPTGEVGEIFMRRLDIEQSYTYIGSVPAKTTADGYTSVGDLGWVDEDGYLFIADRRVDLIITGGANVFPAEVEAALTEHTTIADVAVIGLPDEEWGKRVHAVVQFKEGTMPSSLSELDRHCRERLTAYKVPKSYDVVAQLPRDPAGKIRRSALIADRSEDRAIEIIFVRS